MLHSDLSTCRIHQVLYQLRPTSVFQTVRSLQAHLSPRFVESSSVTSLKSWGTQTLTAFVHLLYCTSLICKNMRFNSMRASTVLQIKHRTRCIPHLCDVIWALNFGGPALLYVKICLPVSTYPFLNEESLGVWGVPPCTLCDFIIAHLIGSLDINSSIYSSSDLLHLGG